MANPKAYLATNQMIIQKTGSIYGPPMMSQYQGKLGGKGSYNGGVGAAKQYMMSTGTNLMSKGGNPPSSSLNPSRHISQPPPIPPPQNVE